MQLIAVFFVAALAVVFVYASIRVLREYERGVVFTLGRYTGTKGPGLFLLVPFVQQMVRVDLRVVVDTLVERTAVPRGRLEHSSPEGLVVRFLPALNKTDRACNTDQPDANMEGRCDEQLLQP